MKLFLCYSVVSGIILLIVIIAIIIAVSKQKYKQLEDAIDAKTKKMDGMQNVPIKMH